MRKAIVYIACSLDGYIAAENDDLKFLDAVLAEGEDYGYAEFMSGVDTIITGSRTYNWVKTNIGSYPIASKKVIVISSTLDGNKENVAVFSGNIGDLIRDLKSKDGQDIFIEGGGYIVKQCLDELCVDEFIVSIIPVILGAGVPLFQHGLEKNELVLKECKSYPSGLVQLHYLIKDS